MLQRNRQLRCLGLERGGCMRGSMQLATCAARWIRASPSVLNAARHAHFTLLPAHPSFLRPSVQAADTAFRVSTHSFTKLSSVPTGRIATAGSFGASPHGVFGSVSVSQLCARFHSLAGSRPLSVGAGDSSTEPENPRFAIVGIGGKQYKVVEGDRITTEKLIGQDVGECRWHLSVTSPFGLSTP